MGFLYENQGHITYLTYTITADDVVDSMSLGMITNNKIPGLAPCIFTQMDMTQYVKFNVSAKISVQQFFSGSVKKSNLIGVFKGILSAILTAEDYMIDASSLILDLNYIFVDVSTCEIAMICLPIENGPSDNQRISVFFKNTVFSTQFDQSENGDYVAKIINFLNSSATFSPVEFQALLDSLDSSSSAVVERPSVESKPVVQVSQNKKQPEVPRAPVAPASDVGKIQETTKEPVAAPAPQQTVTPSVMSIPTASNSAQPISADDTGEKKKGGLFGLFGKKKSDEPQKAPKQTTKEKPVVNKPSAIPEQKRPAQNMPHGFAIPGQQVSIQSDSPKIAVPDKGVTGSAMPVTAGVQQNAGNDSFASSIPNNETVMPKATTPSRPMNFGETAMLGGGSGRIGETTVLGGGGRIGETTVLGADAQEVQTRPHLIRTKNNEKINLDKPVFRIGKEKSYVDYFISDNTAVSRSHCNIISRDGQYFIVDTNSTNHTYVNGGMIQSNVETPLSHGTKFRLANEDFEFKLY